MKRYLLLFAIILPLAGQAQQPARLGKQCTMQVGGLTRSYWLVVPPQYDGVKQLPLVIAFHGARGGGSGMSGFIGLEGMAARYGFIGVCPDGLAGDRTWNGLFGHIPGGEGILADDPDDVAFTRALIQSLQASYHVDPARIYAGGFSAGAYMAERAGVELSDLLAAVMVCQGSLGIKSLNGVPSLADVPQPVAPISVLQLHGGQDRVVKEEGGQSPKNLFKSFADCVQYWVKADGCSPQRETTVDAEHGVTRVLYSGGKGGTAVESLVVAACNHDWPHVQKYGISASEEMWQFFAAHPKQL